MTRRLIALAIAAIALPGTASAGIATAVSRDVPLEPGRALASASPGRFDLVGVTWKGSGTVAFRVHRLTGGWSRWLSASPEAGDAPDAGSAEALRARGRRAGSPWWVGAANRIEYRTSGRVRALRATFVRSPEARIPFRLSAAAGSPAIVPRAAWGADESIRRGGPDYAPAIRLAVVHHTAGTNSYSRSEAAAIVRGIQAYHVKANGWNDIGYNLLVDRFGTVYEGRYGGVDRNVVGAHAQGFNTGSVGIAVLGTYEAGSISEAAEAALAQTVAWRLDLAHVDPASTLSYVSNGNPRFATGLPVFLRAVSGHRDTGQTSCPGDALHARLDAIAQRAQAIGLPKIYEPLVEGRIGGPVRITARLSEPLAWTVHATDATGAEVASGTGFGAAVDWTWDATAAAAGAYAWRIEAGPSATAATGAVAGPVTGGAAAALAFTGAAAGPETITPNADGLTDTTAIVYTLNGNANVRAVVVDAAGLTVAQLEPARWRRAGEHTIAFDGLGLADGVYTIALRAKGVGGAEASSSVTVAVTRTLGLAGVAPLVLSPNGDGKDDRLRVSFTLAQPATVAVRILRQGRWVATPFAGLLAGGPQLIEWDGTKRVGRVRDGTYSVRIEATDLLATSKVELPFATDARPPVVKLVSASPPRLAVSEPARISARVNGARRFIEATAAGEVPIPGIERVRTLVLVARDAAGNRTTLRRP